MRCFKWNPLLKHESEKQTAISRITFHEVPPKCFAKDYVVSLANVVRDPLYVAFASQNGKRPGCAKVKVQDDLLAQFPKRNKIVKEDDEKIEWGINVDTNQVRLRA